VTTCAYACSSECLSSRPATLPKMPLDPGGHRLQTSKSGRRTPRLIRSTRPSGRGSPRASSGSAWLPNGGESPDNFLTVSQISGRVGLLLHPQHGPRVACYYTRSTAKGLWTSRSTSSPSNRYAGDTGRSLTTRGCSTRHSTRRIANITPGSLVLASPLLARLLSKRL